MQQMSESFEEKRRHKRLGVTSQLSPWHHKAGACRIYTFNVHNNADPAWLYSSKSSENYDGLREV